VPDFTIRGNPGAIRSRAGTTRSKAEEFIATGDGLARITTDGWNSRAGERFREKFSTEPERWRAAGQGFLTAANALDAYASALESAQSRARWAQREYARGDRVSDSAKASYDADVDRARGEAQAKAAAGQVVTLKILPFHDPGEEIRQSALREYGAAKADLDAAAHVCASGVRAGCDAAPAKRKWYESVGAAIGGFLEGAGEALMDLGKLAMWLTNPAMLMAQSLLEDAQSGLTAEEISAKWKLKLDDVKGMLDALQKDPLEFGKQLGKGMLDWDTWSDDPARALGHLLPDAVIAVLTLGEGTIASRGVKGIEGGAEGLEAMARVDDLAAVSKLDKVDALTALDDVPQPPQGTWRHLDDDALEPWLDTVMDKHPELDRDGVRGTWDYSTDDGYRQMNGHMRQPGSAADPNIQARVDATNKGLDQLPSYEGTTYRGTNLPQSVVDHINGGGRLSDAAFSSSSREQSVAEGFIRHHEPNPTRITVEGHSGVNVKPFSSMQLEDEILFRGGTEFDVVENFVDANGVRTLVIREVR